MGVHRPHHGAAFAFAVLTVVFGIPTIVLDAIVHSNCGAQQQGTTTDYFGSVFCAATDVGIAAGSAACFFGILAMMWLTISEMSESLALRAIVTIGLILTCATAIAGGVLNAYVSQQIADNNWYVHNMTAAAAAMNFAVMLTSLVTAILCWRAPLVAVSSNSVRV
jgi:hypothetical protein